MSKINIIVATTNNMVIGKGNDMPWHLPSDLKNFKKITNGCKVIMGRKCWESIPEKFRPLPNRENIIISRNKSFNEDKATISDNIESLLKDFKSNNQNDDVFVIGGAQIYKESFKYADKLYMTKIDTDIEGDTYLDGFIPSEWQIISKSEIINENGFTFWFEEYKKSV